VSSILTGAFLSRKNFALLTGDPIDLIQIQL
jgi:hypothetical protein